MRARLEDECIPSLVADAVGEVAADVTGIYAILVGEMAVGEEKKVARGLPKYLRKCDRRIRDPHPDIHQNECTRDPAADPVALALQSSNSAASSSRSNGRG